MLQTPGNGRHVWNCRWSRPGAQFFEMREREEPDNLWLCVRRFDGPRSVTEDACAACEHWEPDDIASTS
ncbi:MAG: hypothetical protein HY657_13940 [Acidobacteria bacterium]|nr:hypothetical protein [Acidobacteriota bacterium]